MQTGRPPHTCTRRSGQRTLVEVREPNDPVGLVLSKPPCEGEGGFGMSPWICCTRLQLAAPIGRSPFTALPRTLSLRRRWCPSASLHPVSFLFLLALSFPLHFPFLSLGRLSQRSRPGGGGGGVANPTRPTHPPTHIRKVKKGEIH